MWQDLWVALALLLVFEGVWPFINPQGMRKAMAMISQQDDKSLRVGGFITMLCGLALLYLVH